MAEFARQCYVYRPVLRVHARQTEKGSEDQQDRYKKTHAWRVLVQKLIKVFDRMGRV